MTIKRQYRAQFNDGPPMERKSSREYTHAWRALGVSKHDKPGKELMRVMKGFAGSKALAQNAASRESSWMVDPVIEVVPVTIVPAKMRGTVVTIAHRQEDLPQGWTFTDTSLKNPDGTLLQRWHTWTHPAGEINVSGDPDAAGRTWHAWRKKGNGVEMLRGKPTPRRANGNTLKFATAGAAATVAASTWS